MASISQRLRCKTGNQDSLNYLSGPQISFVPIRKIALGGSKGDVICKFQFPVTSIWVASKDGGHVGDSLYLHLVPLGKVYSGNAIPVDGSEKWFNMSMSVESGTTYRGTLIKFAVPVQTVYLDIGQEAAGTDYTIMMAGSNDIEFTSSVAVGLGPI